MSELIDDGAATDRGDSGRNMMPMASGRAGMKAEPSCRRQAIAPVLMTTKLATRPMKMPKAVQSCDVSVRRRAEHAPATT